MQQGRQHPLQPSLAVHPRLQKLSLMKRLWSEYSSLLVRTKISLPQEDATPGDRRDDSAPTFLTGRMQEIKTRWASEARSIQFDFEFRAVEQERKRVAKELHDESLPNLARLVRALQCGDSAEVDPLVGEVRSTIDAFRDLLGELHPVDLEEIGLVDALDNLSKRYMRMCKRFVVFVAQAEECHLSALQQLCLYRAVQAVLRMFVESNNDMLMISYSRTPGQCLITFKCADKLVSSAHWIAAERADFAAFESWTALAGAKTYLDSVYGKDQFPSDLIMSIAEEAAPSRGGEMVASNDLVQARLAELDHILVHAKDEWSRLIDRDRELFENLAVEAERKRISQEIDQIIVPRLQRISALAISLSDLASGDEVIKWMTTIVSGVEAVLADLHPRLLARAGLLPSIRALVDRFRRASLIDSTVNLDLHSEHSDISQEAKFAIYRVTQEALNNIEKHSGATHAVVTVKHRPDCLVVSIEDNGTGIKSAGSTLSRGLKIIKERALDVAAEVSWGNSVSYATGTIVTISVGVTPQIG